MNVCLCSNNTERNVWASGSSTLIGLGGVAVSVGQRKGVKLKEVLERRRVYPGDTLRRIQRGERLIKEVINHRERSQRAITLPLSKHCSHSVLLAESSFHPDWRY